MPTFETPDPIAVTIEMASGHLQINASDRTDTVVEVRPTNGADDAHVRAAEQTRVEFANGHLLVKTPKPRHVLHSLFGRPPSIDVTIELPTDSRIDAKVWAEVRSQGRLGDATFETAAGHIRLDQAGRLKLRTAAGDVSASRSVGHADVTTSSGKIRLGTVDGTAVLSTSNGDITLGEVTGDVRMKTANGDITLERAMAAVDAKTAFGSVRVGEVVRGTVKLETAFGEVDVGVREGTAAWLDLKSGLGSVRSDLEATGEPGPGDTTVEVRAHTGYGDIVIRRCAGSPSPSEAA